MKSQKYTATCLECRTAAAQAVAGGMGRYHCSAHGICDVPPLPSPPEEEETSVACRWCGSEAKGTPTDGQWCCPERRKWFLQVAAGTFEVYKPEGGGK